MDEGDLEEPIGRGRSRSVEASLVKDDDDDDISIIKHTECNCVRPLYCDKRAWR